MSEGCDPPASHKQDVLDSSLCNGKKNLSSTEDNEINCDDNTNSDSAEGTEYVSVWRSYCNGKTFNEKSNMNKQDAKELPTRSDPCEASGSKDTKNIPSRCDDMKSDSNSSNLISDRAVASASSSNESNNGANHSKKRKELRLYEDQLRTLVPGATDLSRLDLIHSAIDYISDLEEALEARVKKRRIRDSIPRPPLSQLPGYSEILSTKQNPFKTNDKNADKSDETNVVQKIRNAFISFNETDPKGKMLTSENCDDKSTKSLETILGITQKQDNVLMNSVVRDGSESKIVNSKSVEQNEAKIECENELSDMIWLESKKHNCKPSTSGVKDCTVNSTIISVTSSNVIDKCINSSISSVTSSNVIDKCVNSSISSVTSSNVIDKCVNSVEAFSTQSTEYTPKLQDTFDR